MPLAGASGILSLDFAVGFRHNRATTRWIEAMPALPGFHDHGRSCEGGKRAMIMKSGERWHCLNPACGCAVVAESNGEIEGQNPRCACERHYEEGLFPARLSLP